MRPVHSARTADPVEDEFDPDSPEEIEAMLNMIEYLLPQARAVSPSVALHLGLARHELARALAFRKAVLTHFPGLQ